MDRGTPTSAQLSGGAQPPADEFQDSRPPTRSRRSPTPVAVDRTAYEEIVLEPHIILGEN
ncbi:hypothetical protein POF50_007510 [Streptomyces sp. SL13]|jgi:hypothetical protein|uniref:Uncharacterized protein n=1 Tax=Streptantibioticus silvisoli TaxID=2705255 RepID=A0AA90JWK4_9ACTN|nr:hypothetical protein [Streptantibioticus silvisoli]MDI5962558.1 hypothetical protein [Streptantibioticus silvisoli]MDI5969191.1 hypothetical protein [Streptantibioticus silvisoli]